MVELFNKFRKSLTSFLAVFIVLFILAINGCNDQKKSSQLPDVEKETTVLPKEIDGEKYGYIKSISQREEKYFASIVFLNYQLKSDQEKAKQYNSSRIFDDSLDVIELPDAYFLSPKEEKPEEIIVDKSVHILMQTLSHEPDGNFKFNETIELPLFMKLFTDKEYDRYKKIPFKINFSKNQINSITEQYLP